MTNSDPIKYLKKILKNKPELLFIYNIEGTHLLDILFKWVNNDEKRKVVFIEKEKDRLKEEIEKSTLFKTLIEKKKIEFYILPEDNFIIKKLSWDYLFQPFEVISFGEKEPLFEDLKNAIVNIFYGTELIAQSYGEQSKSYFKNVVCNISSLSSFLPFEKVKNAFADIPCLICGAGPELEKNLDFISKNQNSILIIAAGSAIEILLSNGIKPHFCVATDTSEQLLKMPKGMDIPLFMQMQVACSAQRNFTNEKIILPSTKLYPLERYLIESLSMDIQNESNEEMGWTAGLTAAFIAIYLGSKNIVLAGLDFCYKNGGSKDRKKAIKYAKKKANSSNFELVKEKDRNGEDVYTQKDWIVGKKWLEELIQRYRDVAFVNINEGGLEIERAENISPDQIEPAFLLKDQKVLREKRETFLNNAQNNKTIIEREKIETSFKAIRDSIKRCSSMVDKYFKEIETKYEAKDYSLKPFEKELFYEKHLLPSWNIFYYIIRKKLIKDEKKFGADFVYFLNKLIFFKNEAEDFLKQNIFEVSDVRCSN